MTLGDTMEDKYWTFMIEMYFMGLGMALGSMMTALSDIEPESEEGAYRVGVT